MTGDKKLGNTSPSFELSRDEERTHFGSFILGGDTSNYKNIQNIVHAQNYVVYVKC